MPAGAGVVKTETAHLLAILDALDRVWTDVTFGMRDETLLPYQQEAFGQLLEAIGLLLQRHADLALAALEKCRVAKQTVQAPGSRTTGRTASKK